MDKNIPLTFTLAFAVPLPAIAALQSPAVAAYTCLVSCEDLSRVSWWTIGEDE